MWTWLLSDWRRHMRTKGMPKEWIKRREKKVHATEFSDIFFFLSVGWWPNDNFSTMLGYNRTQHTLAYSINLLVLFNVWSNNMYKLCQAMHVLTHISPFHSSFTIFSYARLSVFFILLLLRPISLNPLLLLFDFRLSFWNELEWNPLDQTDDFIICFFLYIAFSFLNGLHVVSRPNREFIEIRFNWLWAAAAAVHSDPFYVDSRVRNSLN